MKTSSFRSAYAADEVSNTDKNASTCHFVSATLRRVFFPAGSPEGRKVGQAKASSRVGVGNFKTALTPPSPSPHSTESYIVVSYIPRDLWDRINNETMRGYVFDLRPC
jgi:hypothetical protein